VGTDWLFLQHTYLTILVKAIAILRHPTAARRIG
jgi:hypothetical protein